MNTQIISQSVNELNKLILEGKAMEAFEKFYHDEVVMQENELQPVVGKDANRQRELDFFGNITEFRGASVERVAVGDNCSMVEWFMDYSHAQWGDRKYRQVSVQEWKDGKIISEKFYYPN